MNFTRGRFVFLGVITLGLLVVFFWYLKTHQYEFMELLQFSPMFVCLLLVLTPAFMVLDGLISVNLYQKLGAAVSFWDGILLSAVSALVNQLPVSGGIVSKGYYLKRIYGLSYSRFASAFLALFFCFVTVNGIMGSAVLVYWAVFTDRFVPVSLVLAFSGMALCVLVFFLPVNRIPLPQVVRQRLFQAFEGWITISGNPILVLKIIGLQMCMTLMLAARYWFAFHMLSQNVTLSQAILFAAASVLTQLVTFIPGGLGVREVIVAWVAFVLGFDAGISVLATGLDRLLSTVMIVLVGGFGFIVLEGRGSNRGLTRNGKDT